MCVDTPVINVAAAFVDRAAAAHPSRIAILGSHCSTSYGELAALTRRAAVALARAGCRPGDRVLLALPDGVELVSAFFGAARLGSVPVAVSPTSGPAEFGHYLTDVTPRVVIAPASTARSVATAAAQHRCDVRVITDDRTTDAPSEWGPLLAASSGEVDTFVPGPTDPAAFVYTSGSTARQKAVVHSHDNFALAARNVGKGVFGLEPDDRILCVSKVTFAFGLGFGMFFPLAVGASTILNGAPVTLPDVAALIARHRPTVLAAVPSFLSALLRASTSWLPLDLSSLRFVASAGEPLSERLMRAYQEQHSVTVIDGLGSTEMLTHFISNRPGQVRPGSCGTAVPGCELELREDDGRAVAPGEIGTLWVKSRSAFLEYWRRPELTARTRIDGWVRTGDLLYCNDDGAYHYCGRRDDAVKVSGMWVSTQDVERAVTTHPDVDRAFITTREDPDGIDRLVAYVVPREGADVSSLQVLRHLGGRLPEFMMPAAVVIMAELPLTLNGKVARSELPVAGVAAPDDVPVSRGEP